MPVPVNIEKTPQEKVWYFYQNEFSNYSTGNTLYHFNNLNDSFLNSRISEDFIWPSNNQLTTQHNITNKKFLKLSNLIEIQYRSLIEFYNIFTLNDIKTISSGVISNLLSLSPDAFSLELTNEESIFYTLKKDNYSFYLQQFFETEDDGFNATLVTFNGDAKLNSINGNIDEILSYIEQQFSNVVPSNLNLTLINGISY